MGVHTKQNMIISQNIITDSRQAELQLVFQLSFDYMVYNEKGVEKWLAVNSSVYLSPTLLRSRAISAAILLGELYYNMQC